MVNLFFFYFLLCFFLTENRFKLILLNGIILGGIYSIVYGRLYKVVTKINDRVVCGIKNFVYFSQKWKFLFLSWHCVLYILGSLFPLRSKDILDDLKLSSPDEIDKWKVYCSKQTATGQTFVMAILSLYRASS